MVIIFSAFPFTANSNTEYGNKIITSYKYGFVFYIYIYLNLWAIFSVYFRRYYIYTTDWTKSYRVLKYKITNDCMHFSSQ